MRAGIAVMLLLFLFPFGCLAQEELIQKREGHTVTPEIVTPTERLLEQVTLPPDFQIQFFATGLGAPRMMATGEDGTVYVTRPDSGEVLALKDRNGDGKAEEIRTAVSGMPDVHGIALHDGRMYLATVNEVYSAPMQDGTPGKPQLLIDDLPPGGRHPNRTLGVGPDKMLYISVGSTCNCCFEKNPESAAIIRTTLDGKHREVFASGLRNTVGFDWHPDSGQLFGMDNGTDWLGDKFPPEELNLLESGKFYGWPLASGGEIIEIRDYPADFNKDKYLARTTPPLLGYRAHSAPLQMAFYTGAQFPEEYSNDAFVAMHGSWNRKPPSGYEVVRIKFDSSGNPIEIRQFATGFFMKGQNGAFARPAGLTVAKDGALLFSCDKTGTIFRISHSKSEEP